MINPEIVTKFSGPPGTGKSTTLLNVVESLLGDGVDPEQIVYTTFTRAGAYEARDRACARFKLSPDRLPYFKTLHALCYSLLPHVDVMGPADWQMIGKSLHLFFSESGTIREEGVLKFRTKGDVLMSLWFLSRLTQKSLDEIWTQRGYYKGPEILRSEFNQFIDAVQAYKSTFGKMDFADMLEKWLAEGADMNADYIIVDEAQDLTALQWAVVEKLARQAKRVWIAGDDDQCIYEWSGAHPQGFIDLKAKDYEVLPQSYRIPSTVHALAQSVISKVKNRLAKEYKPREEAGAVTRVASLDQVDMSEGSWLLLAYANYGLDDYIRLCRTRGLRYEGAGPEFLADQKALTQVRTWDALVRGTAQAAGDLKRMYVSMSQVDRVKRGAKILLNKIADDRKLTYDELVAEFGLLAPRQMPWDQALDMLPEGQVAYLRAMAGNPGHSQARIRISTIHGSKGKEADHVVISSDLSRQAFLQLDEKPDTIHRVFYVGVTRTKKSLFLLEPTTAQAYPI